MYIVHITLSEQADQVADAEALFARHAAWFKQYFDAGNFLIVGPYTDRAKAGVIIAQAPSREALEQILSEDVYYPDLAIYEVGEFAAKMIAGNLPDYQG